jgi:hypothetical protein
MTPCAQRFRPAGPRSSSRYGWRYDSLSRVAPPRDVTLLGAPTVRIPVAALLPSIARRGG